MSLNKLYTDMFTPITYSYKDKAGVCSYLFIRAYIRSNVYPRDEEDEQPKVNPKRAI